MTDPAPINNLLKGFPSSTREQWTALAKKELGDQDPFETLTRVSADGLHVKPYYDKSDLNPGALHNFQLAASSEEFKGPRSWDNLPPVRVMDEPVANKKALEHLTAGAEGILFDLAQKERVDFDKLLTGIALEYCNVSFLVSSSIQASGYFSYLENKGLDKQHIIGTFFWKNLPNEMIAPQSFQNFQCYGISIPASHPIDEISNALVIGNNCIQLLLKKGWKIETAISSISFSIGIDTDFFASIAKVKALRYVWFQVAHAHGFTDFKPGSLVIHARSEAWVNPDFQPHGNLLKETNAAMAAVLGGANGLTIYPEDIENEVMNRIARNTSHILREESHLNKVADPLAGAYLMENMVAEIAEKAWANFQSQF